MNVKTAARIQSVEDARYFAQRYLPSFLYDGLLEGGVGAGTTVADNLAAFEQVRLVPRAAVHVPERDLRTTVLGHDVSMPVLIAPTGFLRIGRRVGEVGVARAAGAMGTIHVMSSAGGYSVEEVTAAASGPIFYQLFLFGGRQVAETAIERARKAGCQALVITVDTMAHGMRERPVRRRTPMPGTPLPMRELIRMLPRAMRHPAWVANFLSDPWTRSMLRKNGVLRLPMALSPDGQPMSVADAMIGNYLRPFVWEDFSWVREQWNGPIVIKGVLRPDDARRAVDAGASAVVVSNHGGNVYDGAPATLRVLPDILDAVGSDAEVLVDSGVRRGGDVVKALALGARAVLVGRASAYGFMAAGEDGVRRVLEVIRDELDQALAYIGCPSVRELDSSYVDARNLI